MGSHADKSIFSNSALRYCVTRTGADPNNASVSGMFFPFHHSRNLWRSCLEVFLENCL